MIKRFRQRLLVLRRMVVLRTRGRVRHTDRFGLSYWIWDHSRALATRAGQPRTDDTGVLEQLRNAYRVIEGSSDKTAGKLVSFDVGAYIGVISLAMSRFGFSNHVVHSFEADDLNFDHLKQNVAGGSSPGISIHNIAVADLSGTAEFTRNIDHGTNHLGSAAEAGDSPVVVYEVPVTSLDDFVEANGIDTIDVLKIDVEGADLNVLRGAEGLLGNERIKVLIVEIPMTVEQRSEMIDLLSAHGYSTAYIVRNTTKLAEPTETTYSGSERAPLNMISVRPDLADPMGVAFTK